MSPSLEICAKLAAAGCGTLQVDLFGGFLPPKGPVRCISVAPAGGVPGDRTFDGPAWDCYRFQVFIRAIDMMTAEPLALKAYQALDAVANEDLAGTRYLTIQALQPPYLLNRESLGAVEMAFNILAWRRAVADVDHTVPAPV